MVFFLQSPLSQAIHSFIHSFTHSLNMRYLSGNCNATTTSCRVWFSEALTVLAAFLQLCFSYDSDNPVQKGSLFMTLSPLKGPTHLFILSHWGLGCGIQIWQRHKHSALKNLWKSTSKVNGHPISTAINSTPSSCLLASGKCNALVSKDIAFAKTLSSWVTRSMCLMQIPRLGSRPMESSIWDEAQRQRQRQ